MAIALDGGRLMTRESGRGPGVHGEGWKEDKVACLYTLGGPDLGTDPHPDPPRVFTDPVRVDELARDIHAHRGTTPDWPALPASAGQATPPKASPDDWLKASRSFFAASVSSRNWLVASAIR